VDGTAEGAGAVEAARGPAPSLARSAPALAPLWARTLVGAGLILLATEGVKLVMSPHFAVDVIPPILAPILALVLASSEPRLTRASFYSYAAAWLCPLCAVLALAPADPGWRLQRTTIFLFAGLACAGGVASARGMRSQPGASRLRIALRGVLRIAAGGVALIVLTALLYAAVGFSPLGRYRAWMGSAQAETFALLIFLGPIAVGHEVVSWLARGRPQDGSGLARAVAAIGHAFSMREPERT
jgi:hypothetical protein